jgi:hypothetical protein
MCITNLHDTPPSGATKHSADRGLSRVQTWVTSPATVSRQPSPAKELIDELESDSEVESDSISPLEAHESHVQDKPVAAIRLELAESPFDRLGGMCRRRPISLSTDPPVEPQQVASTSEDTSRQGRGRSFPLSDDSNDIPIISKPAHVGSRGWQCPPAFEPFMRYAFDTPPPGGFDSAKTTSEGGASDARVDRDDIDHRLASSPAVTAVEVVDKLRQHCLIDVEDPGLADIQGGRKDIIPPDRDHAEESESGREQRNVSPESNFDDLEGANEISQVACQTKYICSDSPAGPLAEPSTPASRSFNTASELGTPLSASIVEHILGDSKAHDHPRSPARVGHLHSDVILETASSIFLAIGRALDELRARSPACQCDEASLHLSPGVLPSPSNPPKTPSGAMQHRLRSPESGVRGAPPTPCSPER